MIQDNEHSTAECLEAAFYPSTDNPAIAFCTEAWQKMHAATLKRTKNEYAAERCAGKAFCLGLAPRSPATGISATSSPAPATACYWEPSRTKAGPSSSTPPRSLSQPISTL